MSNCTDCTPEVTPCYSCGCTEACDCPTPDYTNVNCPNGSISTSCVTYSGDDNACLSITKPITLTGTLAKLFLYLKNIFSNVTSDSLVVTPSAGSCNSSLTVELVPSADTGNILTLGTDGRPFVPESGGVIINNNDCIYWNRAIINGSVVYTPHIDWDCVAIQICGKCNIVPTTCVTPVDVEVASQNTSA